MKDLLRDDLKYKEISSKPWEKDPYHHHIWDFAYFYRYGNQYLTYLPWTFLSKIFEDIMFTPFFKIWVLQIFIFSSKVVKSGVLRILKYWISRFLKKIKFGLLKIYIFIKIWNDQSLSQYKKKKTSDFF